jgi:hypothetical protein
MPLVSDGMGPMQTGINRWPKYFRFGTTFFLKTAYTVIMRSARFGYEQHPL